MAKYCCDYDERLLRAALHGREKSYSPYSHFAVGAALLCTDGTIYEGCNVENASYGLTNCAERTAIFKAVSEGKTDFTALAVIGQGPEPCSPCGACRQVMAEFRIPRILMAGTADGGQTFQCQEAALTELLPFYFDHTALPKE